MILLSRSNPELVDAEYTKNQAWKSEAVSIRIYDHSVIVITVVIYSQMKLELGALARLNLQASTLSQSY